MNNFQIRRQFRRTVSSEGEIVIAQPIARQWAI
jgi:hypothetical protein